MFYVFLTFVFFLVLVTNDKTILHHDNIQKQKVQNLLKNSSYNVVSKSHITVRVIFNFSLYELIGDGKCVLFKGLFFSVKPGLIQYSEYLILFELLFCDIKREDLCNEDVFNYSQAVRQSPCIIPKLF